MSPGHSWASEQQSKGKCSKAKQKQNAPRQSKMQQSNAMQSEAKQSREQPRAAAPHGRLAACPACLPPTNPLPPCLVARQLQEISNTRRCAQGGASSPWADASETSHLSYSILPSFPWDSGQALMNHTHFFFQAAAWFRGVWSLDFAQSPLKPLQQQPRDWGHGARGRNRASFSDPC